MKIKYQFQIFYANRSRWKLIYDCVANFIRKINVRTRATWQILFLQESPVARDSQFPAGLCSNIDIINQDLLYHHIGEIGQH